MHPAHIVHLPAPLALAISTSRSGSGMSGPWIAINFPLGYCPLPSALFAREVDRVAGVVAKLERADHVRN